jgi:hypothetical protein
LAKKKQLMEKEKHTTFRKKRKHRQVQTQASGDQEADEDVDSVYYDSSDDEFGQIKLLPEPTIK